MYKGASRFANRNNNSYGVNVVRSRHDYAANRKKGRMKARRRRMRFTPEPMKYRDICANYAPSKSDVKGRAKRAIDIWDVNRGW